MSFRNRMSIKIKVCDGNNHIEILNINPDININDVVESLIEWAEVNDYLENERWCVKCGKTSGLIDDEDICYTCAEERNRI